MSKPLAQIFVEIRTPFNHSLKLKKTSVLLAYDYFP
jgi:hypothetical protein